MPMDKWCVNVLVHDQREKRSDLESVEKKGISLFTTTVDMFGGFAFFKMTESQISSSGNLSSGTMTKRGESHRVLESGSSNLTTNSSNIVSGYAPDSLFHALALSGIHAQNTYSMTPIELIIRQEKKDVIIRMLATLSIILLDSLKSIAFLRIRLCDHHGDNLIGDPRIAAYHAMGCSNGSRNAVKLIPKALDVVQTVNNDDIILGKKSLDCRHERASGLLFVRSSVVGDVLVEIQRLIVDNVNPVVLGLWYC